MALLSCWALNMRRDPETVLPLPASAAPTEDVAFPGSRGAHSRPSWTWRCWFFSCWAGPWVVLGTRSHCVWLAGPRPLLSARELPKHSPLWGGGILILTAY